MAQINPSSVRTAAVFAAFVTVLGLAKSVPTIPTETEARQNPGDEPLSEELKLRLIEKYGNTFPSYLTGYDYDGSPVFVFEFGHYKYATIPEDEEEDFIKFLDYIIRTVVHQAAKNSRKGVGFIADFEDFLPGHFNTPGGKRLATKAFQFTGDISAALKYGIMINENSAAEELMTTVADGLGDFQYRMESYGTEKDEWMPKLLKKIPKDQLALKYGGVSDFKPVEFHG